LWQSALADWRKGTACAGRRDRPHGRDRCGWPIRTDWPHGIDGAHGGADGADGRTQAGSRRYGPGTDGAHGTDGPHGRRRRCGTDWCDWRDRPGRCDRALVCGRYERSRVPAATVHCDRYRRSWLEGSMYIFRLARAVVISGFQVYISNNG
jgi:hypothetical protein